MFVAGWKISPYGEIRLGPLAAIASDGDPNRTAALHLICMEREVKAGDPLHQYVSGLPGLNLFTSADFLTQEFDPKHNWKCMLSNFQLPPRLNIPQVFAELFLQNKGFLPTAS
jgi:hypothetical protein